MLSPFWTWKQKHCRLMLFCQLPACRTRATAGKIKHAKWLGNAFIITILACLTKDLCLWLEFNLGSNGEYYWQFLITDIALSLIFCHLYPLQAPVQMRRALTWHTAQGVKSSQKAQLTGGRLLTKPCCAIGNTAKNTNLLSSWPRHKLSISVRDRKSVV